MLEKLENKSCIKKTLSQISGQFKKKKKQMLNVEIPICLK